MDKDSINNQGTDPSQDLNIQILSARLAKRVEAYANETGNTLTSTVIETLDISLRQRTNRDD